MTEDIDSRLDGDGIVRTGNGETVLSLRDMLTNHFVTDVVNLGWSRDSLGKISYIVHIKW